MKNLKTVTVFRYDEKTNAWSKHFVPDVFIAGSSNTYTLTDTLNKDAHLTLRVLGDIVCDVVPSDVIFLGTHQGETPPEDSVVVVSVVRNEQGKKTAHTKISCR